MKRHSLAEKLLVLREGDCFKYMLKSRAGLIAINPSPASLSRVGLTHAFYSSRSLALAHPFPAYLPQGGPSLPNSSAMKDLSTIQVGDFCFCYLRTGGIYNDFSVIAVTDMSQSASKTPVLFTENLLGVCAIGKGQNLEAQLRGIKLLKRCFQDDTLVFTSLSNVSKALKLAKVLLGGVRIEQKLKLVQAGQLDSLIPTTLGEEKATNPFMRLSEISGQDELRGARAILSKLYD